MREESFCSSEEKRESFCFRKEERKLFFFRRDPSYREETKKAFLLGKKKESSSSLEKKNESPKKESFSLCKEGAKGCWTRTSSLKVCWAKEATNHALGINFVVPVILGFYDSETASQPASQLVNQAGGESSPKTKRI